MVSVVVTVSPTIVGGSTAASASLQSGSRIRIVIVAAVAVSAPLVAVVRLPAPRLVFTPPVAVTTLVIVEVVRVVASPVRQATRANDTTTGSAVPLLLLVLRAQRELVPALRGGVVEMAGGVPVPGSASAGGGGGGRFVLVLGRNLTSGEETSPLGAEH